MFCVRHMKSYRLHNLRLEVKKITMVTNHQQENVSVGYLVKLCCVYLVHFIRRFMAALGGLLPLSRYLISPYPRC